MGYVRHVALVVTGHDYSDAIDRAHVEAVRICGERVTSLIRSPVNGYRSFMAAPDGSKLGWRESDEATEQREQLKSWMKLTRHEDGSGPLAWVEVQFGDDELDTRVVDDSDADVRDKRGV